MQRKYLSIINTRSRALTFGFPLPDFVSNNNIHFHAKFRFCLCLYCSGTKPFERGANGNEKQIRRIFPSVWNSNFFTFRTNRQSAIIERPKHAPLTFYRLLTIIRVELHIYSPRAAKKQTNQFYFCYCSQTEATSIRKKIFLPCIHGTNMKKIVHRDKCYAKNCKILSLFAIRMLLLIHFLFFLFLLI